jgi:hypothetical protein
MKIKVCVIALVILLSSCYSGGREFVILSSKSGLSDSYQEYRVTLRELVENTENGEWAIVLYNKKQ